VSRGPGQAHPTVRDDTGEMRPAANEHDPYYSRYISLVPEGDIVPILEAEWHNSEALFTAISEQQAGTSYEPGKWTIKELIGHLSDTERILCYRALRIARNDTKPMEGFDQDPYVENANFNRCALRSLTDEFRSVREATLTLFGNLEGEAWTRRGTANNAEITVRALAYIIAGHEMHHRRILQTRYLSSSNAG
jgi:hypothetical protein